MIHASQNYLSAIYDYSRQMKTRVYFNDSDEAIENELISVEVIETAMSSSRLILGDIATNKVTIKFYMPDSVIPLENGKVRVEHGLFVGQQGIEDDDIDDGYEYVPMGTYYIQDIQRSYESSIVSITGYDCTMRLRKDYVPTIEYPAHIRDIIDDISQQCHVSFEEYDYPDIIIDSYSEGTNQEMLCYIAGLLGCNIKANREDHLCFYWWKETNHCLSLDVQYLGQFQRNMDQQITIHSLTSGSEKNEIVSGEGTGITFMNPYMTQDRLDKLLEGIQGFHYMPCTVQYRGNPILEVGDIVLVEDKGGSFYPILLSENKIVLTGMNAQIHSLGEKEDHVSMGNTPMQNQLKKLYRSLESAFKESTEVILGNKGGYFVIDRDQDGFPIGFKIMDTPTLTENTKGWIFNKDGFGYSDNGFLTLENIAIDMLGNINANTIHTGVIQGNCFDIDLDTGSIVMGERGEDGLIDSEWFRVDENGISLSISNQTLEDIKDMNDRIHDIDESIEKQKEELKKYFRWNEKGVEIGDSLSPIKMLLTNEKLSFLQSDDEVAYITNNKLYITEGLFMQKSTVGDENVGYYEWLIRTNGNMSLKYRGVKKDGK